MVLPQRNMLHYGIIRRHPADPVRSSYECADGKYVAVGCVEPHFYAQFVSILGIDDADLPFQLDPSGWPQLKKVIGTRFKEHTRDEWAAAFADSDACVTPVLSPWEAHEHPHNRERGVFIDIDGVRQPAPAPRFNRTPTATPEPMSKDPARVGSMLSGWGLGAEVISRLLAR